MENRSAFALVVTCVAVGLALAGNLLLRGTAWGLNLPLWIALAGACGFGLLRKSDVTLSRAAKWLFLPILVFSACFFWRDSDALKVANGVMLAIAISILAQRAQIGKPGAATLMDYSIKLALVWITFTGDFATLIASDIDWRKGSPSTKHLSAFIRGVLLALPLLLLFGGLFASADAAFGKAISDLLAFDVVDLMGSGLVVLMIATVVGGVFRRLLWPPKPAAPPLPPIIEPPERRSLGLTEAVVALTAVNALFVSFVGFQFKYLFGGAHKVAEIAGLTYAQYARNGFFELTAVAVLIIPVLIGAQQLVPADSVSFKRWFAAQGTVLTACVFVVLTSALVRMGAYVQAYGLSELRLFTTLFIGWIAVTLLWLSLSWLLKNRSFSFGALMAGYGFVLLANLINPDALIANTNLQKAKSPDLAYLSTLSLDAEPAIAANLHRLSPDESNKLWAGANAEWRRELQGADWRALNVSRLRYRARSVSQ